MNPFKSTIDNPLYFLKCYLNIDGESFLRDEFQAYSNHDYYYEPQDDCIHEIDLETNKLIGIVSFTEYVKFRIETELKITKEFIYEKNRLNGKDQDAKLYATILLDCLAIQKYVDSKKELNFKEDINQFISQLLTIIYKKFERFHPKSSEIKQVKDYYKKKKNSNITGYKLKVVARNATIREIYDRMIEDQFFSKRFRFESFQQFFRGEFPKYQIDWTKELHELWYFIDQLSNSDSLEKPPGQKWKYIRSIFTHRGDKLPERWERNHNKLHDQSKRDAIDRIINMFQLRKE